MRLTAEEIEAKAAKNRAAWQPTTYMVTKFTNGFPPMQPTKVKRVSKQKEVIPTESQEQIALIAWCDLHPIAKHIYAIPNGSHKSIAAAIRFRREGLRKGYPDLGLDVACGGFHGLKIELKRVKGGVVSPEQKEWIEFLTAQGYRALVCHGADEAIRVIEGYLEVK